MKDAECKCSSAIAWQVHLRTSAPQSCKAFRPFDRHIGTIVGITAKAYAPVKNFTGCKTFAMEVPAWNWAQVCLCPSFAAFNCRPLLRGGMCVLRWNGELRGTTPTTSGYRRRRTLRRRERDESIFRKLSSCARGGKDNGTYFEKQPHQGQLCDYPKYERKKIGRPRLPAYASLRQ